MATDTRTRPGTGPTGSSLGVRKKFTVASLLLVLAVAAGGVLLYVGGAAGGDLPPAALAGGGLIAVALLSFVGVAWRNVAQLTDLAGAATAVSRGDLDTEVDLDRSDELGQLSASLDTLRTELQETEAAEADDSEDELAEEVEERAREFSEVAARCADGDFTSRMDPEGEVEAMNEVARQFNRTMDEIEETVVDLQEFAQTVANASEDVNGAAQDVRESSQEVAGSVREVVTTTEDGLDAVSGEMEGLSTMTEQIASSSNQVAQLSRRTAETGRDGREAAQSAIYGMNEIREQSGAAVEEIDQLREEMAQIDDLLEFITSIAERTNMLALNANIEASRGAGDGGGEGFGVVAEEIRELADDTKDTAGEIEQRLERIQAQTDSTAEKVEATRTEVETHAEAVENAIEALDEIAEYAEETNTGIQEINAATEQQAAAAQEIVAIVDDTQSTIDETAATARNVVEAAEDQASVLDDVADSTDDLSKQARWLDDTLSMFRVSSDVDPGGFGAGADAPPEEPVAAATTTSAVGSSSPPASASAADTGTDTSQDASPSAGGAGSGPDAATTPSVDAARDGAPTGATPTGGRSGITTQFATGHATGDDERSRQTGATAAEQALENLDAEPEFCQVFVSSAYDYEAVLAGIREVIGDDVVVVGCSTAGEFTERTAEEGSVALSLVASDGMEFYAGVGEGLSENVSGAVEAAIADFPSDIDRPHLAAINLHDGLKGVGNQIALATQRKLGREVSTAGGSAGDDFAMEETVVFAGRGDDVRVADDAVAIGLIASEEPIVVSVDHGHEPISETYTVTSAEGGVVHELDGEPAFEVYKDAIRKPAMEKLGVDVDAMEPGSEEWTQVTALFEFGIVDESSGDLDHRVRWPGLTESTEGSMTFAVQIPEGEQVQVMFGDEQQQIDAASRVAGDAMRRLGGTPAGAFVYECACRSMILGDDFDQAVDAVQEQIGADVPIAGLEIYGELCMQEGQDSGFHNTTSVVMLLPGVAGSDAVDTAAGVESAPDVDTTGNGHVPTSTNGHAPTSELESESDPAPAETDDTTPAATPAPETDDGTLTRFATGHGAGDDGRQVGAAAAKQALDDLDAEPEFCQVFVSSAYDYETVLAGIREVIGDDAVLIGCSTNGEFTDKAAEEGSVALSLVASDGMEFYAGVGEGLSENVSGAVEAAIADFPSDIDRPHLAAINLHDGLKGVGNQIALATQRKLGREVSTAGGSAGDDFAMEETVVFAGDGTGADQIATDAVAIGLIASERPVIASVDHGHEPISETYTVTSAEGGVVHELDGEPAFEVYKDAIRKPAMEKLGVDVDAMEPGSEEWTQVTASYEFGIVDESGSDLSNRVRWPGLTESTDGPMNFAVQIPEGEQVQVMFGDEQQQVEAAADVAADAVQRSAVDPAGAFVYECACRSMILGDDFDQAVDALDEEMQVPFAGLETYGELCMQEGQDSGFHNTTSVVMLLPE